jgi:hypothetical protein
MPEGASPDFVCFAYGQLIGTVPVWFLVNYNGVSGYYASYYDDSSYGSDADLTSKYGVPKCGAAPPSTPPVPGPGPALTPAPPAPAAPRSMPVYFSPFNEGDNPAWSRASDPGVATIYQGRWYENPPRQGSCGRSAAAGWARETAKAASPGGVTALAGWSLGRLGPVFYLKKASNAERMKLTYIILIDPGTHSTLTCDRDQGAGGLLAAWLRDNPRANLVVISSSAESQRDSSRGIQESYFNAIRNLRSSSVNGRVLTCNYSLDHYHAFFAAQYWIAHRIDPAKRCPTLRDSEGTYRPAASWHPRG